LEQGDRITGWKDKLHDVIYGTHTRAGKIFDITLLIVIVYSVIIVMLESLPRFDVKYHQFFNISEWVVTILFTIEYILRIICINKPKKYIFSFFGIVDLLSTIPKYLSYFVLGSQYITAFRNNLVRALKASRTKIFVFVFFVLIVAVLLGTVMYLVEGPEHGFKSIPHSIYWTIVTLTTVGYGDISPETSLGQFIATFIMIIGYGIIAVPTGIVSAEYVSKDKKEEKKEEEEFIGSSCHDCGAMVMEIDAHYCRKCGHKLEED